MFKIKIDDLTGIEIHNLLLEHQNQMRQNSPPESRHVLDVEALKKKEITFWSMWKGDDLMGCVALKQWNDHMGEIKSMKTATAFRRQGIGTMLLKHVIFEAAFRGYERLNLETGSMSYFEPAKRLYSKHGFVLCEPFGDYKPDPNNIFMTLNLKSSKLLRSI